MVASGENMNTECEESKSKKAKRGPRGKNDNIMVTSKEETADQEKGKCPPTTREGEKRKPLKDVSNLHPAPSSSLEEELLAVRTRIQKLNIEKEKTDKLLEKRDAMLKQMEADLEIKAKAQENMQLQLKKFQKLKEFKPVLSFPSEQSLRMGELAKEQKKKKKTNLNRLKNPSPPYILWCQEQWNQMKSENPNITFKDMRAIMGEKWKALNAEEKKSYEEKYEAEKEAYLQVVGQEKRENGAFKHLHQERKHKTALDLPEQYFQYKKDAEGYEKGKRREKDPSKPKQPVTAFSAFTNDRHAALLEQKQNVSEISKILERDWNKMVKEEQAPYEQEVSSISKEEEELRKLEKEQMLWLLKKKEKAEILKKDLGDADKKIWDDQVASAMMQYKIEMEEYNKRLKVRTHHQIHFNVEEVEVGKSIAITRSS